MNNKHQVFEIIEKNSPHLKWATDKTILLVRSGSQAYGTNIPGSDEDFRGILIPPKEYFLGTQELEQIELKTPHPDTTIYEIRKFFSLAMQANPSLIETLHTDPKDHLYIDSLGEILLDHKNDFLSTKVKHTFTGYAVAQLHRIKLHKKYIMNPITSYPTRASLGLPEQTLIPADQMAAAEASIRKELDKFQFDFMENLEEFTKIEIRSVMTQMLAELKITSEQHWESAARKIGLTDNLIEVMKMERSYNSAKREYDQYQNWMKTRNPVRAGLEEKFGYDTKHGAHLVRLIRMCKEILTTGIVQVKRPDREELIAIRQGAWTYDQVIEFAEREEQELNEIYKNCKILPKTPNKAKLDQLCMQLIEKSLSNYSWYNVKKKITKLFESL